MEKKFVFLFSVIFASLMLQTPDLRADSFTMKDGTQHDGEVMGEDQTTLFLKEGHDIVSIAKADIQSREGSQNPSIQHTTGGTGKDQRIGGMTFEEMQQVAKQGVEEYGKIAADQKKAEEMHARSKALMETLKPMMENMRTNPAFQWAFNMADEAQAKTRVRKLASTAAVYFMQSDELPSGLRDLVEKDLIEKEFAQESYDGYRYDISSSEDGYRVYASPVNPKLGLKSFVYRSDNNHIEEGS